MVLQVGGFASLSPATDPPLTTPTDRLPSPELRGLAPRAAEDLVTRERQPGGWPPPLVGFVDVLEYIPKVKHSLWKMVVRRLLSYWGGLFSGAMLNFEGVRLEQEFKIKSHHVIFSQTNLLLKPRMFDCFFVCSSSFVVLKSGCVLFLSNLPSAPKDEVFVAPLQGLNGMFWRMGRLTLL